MKLIKLLIVTALLSSCTTPELTLKSQLNFKAQEKIAMEKAIKLEKMGLREYTVITRDSVYRVELPADSVIYFNTAPR